MMSSALQFNYVTRLGRRQRLKYFFKKVLLIIMSKKIWIQDISVPNAWFNMDKIQKHIHLSYNQELLSNIEKVLYIDPSDRTIEERKLLVSHFVNNESLKFLSPKVRARMSSKARLMMIGRGRFIISEGHRPTEMYFITKGSVEILEKTYDPLLRKDTYLSHPAAMLGLDDHFGHMEFIEGYKKRVSTYRAATDVKLICIELQDFDNILRKEMEHYWHTKKYVIKNLKLFNFFTEKQILDACLVSRLKEFKKNDTIYVGSDQTYQTFAYFVLRGECMVVQELQKSTLKKEGNLKVPKEDPITLTHADLLRMSLNVAIENKFSDIKLSSSKTSFLSNSSNAEIKENTKDVARKLLKKCGLQSNLDVNSANALKIQKSASMKSASVKSALNVSEAYHKNSVFVPLYENQRSQLFESSTSDISSSDSSNLSDDNKIFIDVGRIYHNGLFGFGEKQTKRFIIAHTNVQCLMLPRFWLFNSNQNPLYYWNRIALCLNTLLPTIEKIYDQFKREKRWPKLQQKYLLDLLGPSMLENGCHLEEVPFINRI